MLWLNDMQSAQVIKFIHFNLIIILLYSEKLCKNVFRSNLKTMSWTDKKISLSSLLGSTDKQSKNQVNNLFTHYVLQAVVWLIFKVRIFLSFLIIR